MYTGPGFETLLSVCSTHELRCVLTVLNSIIQKFR